MAGKDLNGKKKPENNYVKLYNSASFWDTITKVRSKYSLRRPLSETPVILKFWTNISATKRPPKGSSPRLFAALWHWASTIQRDCVHTHYKYVAGKDLNGKKSLKIIMSSLYHSASFWDTITKVRSTYSLRRPLSETPVILNFGRIFRLQNGRRREVALVFLQRCDTEQVQYEGIVYTRIINMWLGRIWTAKKAWK